MDVEFNHKIIFYSIYLIKKLLLKSGNGIKSKWPHFDQKTRKKLTNVVIPRSNFFGFKYILNGFSRTYNNKETRDVKS